MKIAIVNHYSGSTELGMEYRHYYLARELQALGHEVLIVASRFSHLRIRQPHRRSIKGVTHGGVRHFWLAGRPYPGNGVRRLLNMLEFSADLWRSAPLLAQRYRPDVVLASSPHPFSAYGAHRLARAAKARFIFEIRDLWPLSLTELGAISPNHPVMRMLDRAEAYGCTQAEKVVSLLPCVHDYMAQRGVREQKWAWLPNGVVPEEYLDAGSELPSELKTAIARIKVPGKLLIGYAGSHGIANALDWLLDAARSLKDGNVEFVLVGAGGEKKRLQQRVTDERLGNVHFFDPILKSQIPALLREFDGAYLGARKSPLYRFGMSPNKMTDYMMSALPIIYAVEAGNDPVSDAGCGLTVPPENGEDLAAAIIALSRMSPEQRRLMGDNGRKHAQQSYAYPRLAQRLIEVIG